MKYQKKDLFYYVDAVKYDGTLKSLQDEFPPKEIAFMKIDNQGRLYMWNRLVANKGDYVLRSCDHFARYIGCNPEIFPAFYSPTN